MRWHGINKDYVTVPNIINTISDNKYDIMELWKLSKKIISANIVYRNRTCYEFTVFIITFSGAIFYHGSL
jgi:hypothetical protein